jgi:two-component system sensor histidine kinase KdpD
LELGRTDGVVDLWREEAASGRAQDNREALAAARLRANRAEDLAEELSDRLRERTLVLGEFEHKIKSAFTVLAGWSRLLDEDWDRLPEDERRNGLAVIRRKVEETVAQAEALLEHVSAEIGAIATRPLRLDMAQILRVTVRDFAGSDRVHRFRYEGPPHVPVTTDPAALQQVLGQLLENAVKYSPAGTTITLEAGHLPTGEVRIAVRDEGPGVPRDVDIFRPFVRGTRVGRDVPGTGLGLYIVQSLVDRMGGLVTAHRNLGGGSSFVLSLPAPEPLPEEGIA